MVTRDRDTLISLLSHVQYCTEILQVTVALPFEMEIILESGSFVDRPNSLSGGIYQAEINSHLLKFDKRFEETFGLEKKGYIYHLTSKKCYRWCALIKCKMLFRKGDYYLWNYRLRTHCVEFFLQI